MGSNVMNLRDLESSSFSQDNTPNEPRFVDLFFKHFTIYSFSVVISLVQMVTYILSKIYPVLSEEGMSYGPATQSGEVWRLFTPLFLHADPAHYLLNAYFQTRMGLVIEKHHGNLKTMVAYFLCGICGNLLSTAARFCIHAVGASTAGFGFIGILVSEIALFWHTITYKEEVAFNLAILFMVCIFWGVLGPSNIDIVGHLGGFIAGCACGIFLNKSMNNPPRWINIGLSLSYFVILLFLVVCNLVIFLIPADKRCTLVK